MAKGENIFKRKDGRWEARYEKGRGDNGKIVYGFCYGKTYAEAKEKVLRCKAALINDTPLPYTRTPHPFGYYCDAWLRTKQYVVRASTYTKYETMLARYIRPQLGGCMPQLIHSGTIDAFTNTLFSRGLSPKTVKDYLVLLRSVLNYTAEQLPGKLHPPHPHYPKEPKKEMRVLSCEEQQRFVAYLLAHLDACTFGILLALSTGIRIGVLCALRWDAVSLTDKTLKISCGMQRVRNPASAAAGDGAASDTGVSRTRIIIGAPKSDTSVRLIPLSDTTAALCKQMYPGNPAAFLLTGQEHYMDTRTLQKRMDRYTAACGLENVHFHTLRHTFATRCIEVGFDIKSLSEILGHASTKITLDRYVHVSVETKRTNMNKLSAVGL